MANKFFQPVKKFLISEIATIANGTFIGEDKQISSLAPMLSCKDTDITFFTNNSYSEYLSSLKAAACLIKSSDKDKLPANVVPIIVADPYLAFATVLQHMYGVVGKKKHEAYQDKTAVVHKSAKIGNNVHISAHVVIEENVIIGDNSYIFPNVTIAHNVEIGQNCTIHSDVSIQYAIIGNNCIFHPGVKIGQDGFGFAPNPSGHIKIPQIGSVIIESNVEIGSNTCIDRGALEDTTIGDGTKIDNLVQIAHGVKIGKGCFIAACAGIAGSTTLEDYVSIGGNCGIAPHIKIGQGAMVGPMSGVPYDVLPKSVLMGIPATPFREFWKIHAVQKRLAKDSRKIFSR